MEENKSAEQIAQDTPKSEEPEAPQSSQATQTTPAAERNESEPEANKVPDDSDADEDGSELPEETWVTDPDAPTSYNWAWRAVIQGLMDRKPAYVAYAEAYDIDISNKSGELQARANSSRLIANDNFKRLWRKVLTEVGFNNETVDSELIKLMTDPTVHPSIRRAAIRDFNELHGRIITKVDHTTKGKEFKAPVILSSIDPRNVGTETEATDGN